jgi:hypothetical protein
MESWLFVSLQRRDESSQTKTYTKGATIDGIQLPRDGSRALCPVAIESRPQSHHHFHHLFQPLKYYTYFLRMEHVPTMADLTSC